MIKDSFDTVLKIHQISPEVFDNGYIFVSFDVESLFTNIPFKNSNIINIYVHTDSNGNQSSNKNKEIYIFTCFWY